MAYTAPTTRADGDIITAAIWNTDIVDNIAALYAAMPWHAVVNKTANYTVLQADNGYLITVDCTSGAVTLTLPTISGLTANQPYSIAVIKTDATSNAVTIARASSDTVNGATSVTIAAQHGGMAVVATAPSTGTAWRGLRCGEVDYSKVTGITAGRLVGRGSTAGNGVGQEISVAKGLAFTGQSLSVTSARELPTINSYFDVWQRATSFTPAAATKTYTADRWAVNIGTGGVATISRQTHTPGYPLGTLYGEPAYFFRWNQSTGGTGSLTLSQFHEGVRTLADFAPDVIVLMWAKVSASTLAVTPKLVQKFGTGGSPSADVTTTGSAKTVTTSWTLFSEVFALPTISGKTLGSNGDDSLELQLSLPTSSTFTLDLAMVALMPGSVVVDVPLVPFEETMARCQRFHHKSFNTSQAEVQNAGINTPGCVQALASGTSVNQYVPFPVEMRAAPTITTYSTNAATANWQGTGTPAVVISAAGTRGASFDAIGTATDQAFYQCNYSADCEL